MTNKTKIEMLKQIELMEGEVLKEDFYYEAALDALHGMARQIQRDNGYFVSVSQLIQEEFDEVKIKYEAKVVDEAKNLKFSFMK